MLQAPECTLPPPHKLLGGKAAYFWGENQQLPHILRRKMSEFACGLGQVARNRLSESSQFGLTLAQQPKLVPPGG